MFFESKNNFSKKKFQILVSTYIYFQVNEEHVPIGRQIGYVLQDPGENFVPT